MYDIYYPPHWHFPHPHSPEAFFFKLLVSANTETPNITNMIKPSTIIF